VNNEGAKTRKAAKAELLVATIQPLRKTCYLPGRFEGTIHSLCQ
jgi:hypothetical protein